jgi:AraC-like DNA-binding protein
MLYCIEAGRDYRFGAHRHESYQWYCVLQGDVKQSIDARALVLGDLQSVLIPPGVVREPRCVGRAPRYLVALFEAEGLPLDDFANQILETPAELRADLSALERELRAPDPEDGRLLVDALLLRLLVGLRRHARRSQQTSSRAPPAAADLVRRVDQYISTHLATSPKRDDLARELKMSPAHLARRYKSIAGVTLGQRLTTMRIERAQVLLYDSSLSVTQIACEVGFQSFSHFSQVFRAQSGVSPSEFRASGALPRLKGEVSSPFPMIGSRI